MGLGAADRGTGYGLPGIDRRVENPSGLPGFSGAAWAEADVGVDLMRDRLRVYVAGAYSAKTAIGIFDNMQRGIAGAAAVFKAGFAPYAPWLDYQYILSGEVRAEADFYELGMAWLIASDAILVITEGLKESKGTQAEIKRAEEQGIPIFYSLRDLNDWAQARS